MAKILLKRKEVASSINELMQIKGMNRTYAQRLIDFGILTLNDLSRETAEVLTQDLKVSENILEIWIDDSKRLTGQSVPSRKKAKAKPAKEKPIEEVEEEVEEKPKEKPTKKPREKPAKKPKEKPVEEPTEAPAEKPMEALPEIAKEEIEKVLKEKLPELPKEKPVEPAVEAKKPLSLSDLKEIGKAELKKLKELDITKIEDLVEEDAEELSTMTGINMVTIKQWIGDIREYLGLPREQEKPKAAEVPAAAAEIKEDSLSKWLKIEGVGKKNAEKLVKAGILDIKELLEGDLKDLSKKSKVSDKDLKKIVESYRKNATK